MMNFFGVLAVLRFRLGCLFNECFSNESCLICNCVRKVSVCRSCSHKHLFRAARLVDCGEFCQACGKRLLSEKGLCSSCRNERVVQSLDWVHSILPYRLWAKNLMFAWKMMESRDISFVLAKTAYLAMDKLYGKELPALVPVPPRPGKIHHKGWDQIQDLAFLLHHVYGVRVLDILSRTQKVQQKKLDRNGRLQQDVDRYVLSGKGKRLVECMGKNWTEGQDILLLDDVITTGGTLECCARVLKNAGFAKICALTLFIVD